MFYLNMVDYTLFFPVLSTLTLDTLLTLWGTWGFPLNHLIPLRPFINVFDNVLLEVEVPLELILTGFDWVGALGVWVLGPGLTIIMAL